MAGNSEVIPRLTFCKFGLTTQIRLKKTIKELAENPAVTILVSSYDLVHTVEVSNRVVILNKGEIVRDI